MRTKAVGQLGLLLAFLLLNGVWVWLPRFLPGGLPRSLGVVGLGVGVVAAYMGLLITHIREILRGRKRFWMPSALVATELGLLLAGFASMYAYLGVLDNTRPGSPVVHDFWLSAYLSVVTFTTVGYGDIYPVGIGRALAALQGLSGYLVLGVLASTAASAVSPYSPAGPFDDAVREEERDRASPLRGRSSAAPHRDRETGPERMS